MHRIIFSAMKVTLLILKELKRPFKFDQALGTSELTHQGTSRLPIGNQILELNESLLSPKSAYTIIPVGKLKEQHGIVAANVNELLARLKDKTPVARLKTIDHILYIEPLKLRDTTKIFNTKVAPSLARVPQVSNANRCHQRLGHSS